MSVRFAINLGMTILTLGVFAVFVLVPKLRPILAPSRDFIPAGIFYGACAVAMASLLIRDAKAGHRD